MRRFGVAVKCVGGGANVRRARWFGVVAVALLTLGSGRVEGQPQSANPVVAASSRVTTSVTFDGRLMGGGRMWLNRSTSHSGPGRMIIDYGQPHARGREIFGGVVPYGQVWRLGANLATHLTLELGMRIGDLEIPPGTYTLYMLPTESGAELIVNRQTRQWGTDYDEARDVGRTALDRRALPEIRQSLEISLEPTFPQPEGSLPAGMLRIAWGELEYSTAWQVVFP